MAITVISSVPVNSGTAPKLPDAPTWSARIAVCGLHSRPNRKFAIGTRSKNRIDSNSTENTIPAVIMIETAAVSSSPVETHCSTRLRARKSRSMRPSPIAMPAPASDSAAAMKATVAMPSSWRHRSAAARIASFGSMFGGRPAAMRRTSSKKKLSIAGDCSATPAGSRLATTQRSTRSPNRAQVSQTASAGPAHSSATYQA